MGLFDFLTNKPTVSNVEKVMKRMLNEHHQQQVRQESMEQLANWGTLEAIQALTRRLAVNFRDTIVNEQEKRWVADALVERFGERSIDPLIFFIRKEQNVSTAVRALQRLVSTERLVEVLTETLGAYAPVDYRSTQAKAQLIDALEEHAAASVLERIVPFIADHDDDVRIKVIEQVQARFADAPADSQARACDGLVGALLDPEAASRIQRRVGEALAAVGAELSAYVADGRLTAAVMPEGYTLTSSGRVERR
jgi:HEAT repeat protein